MIYYWPTPEEIARLGFTTVTDDHGYDIIYIGKGPGRCLELINDEGAAVATEWLEGEIHAWTTCENYESLEHACNTAFDTIADGERKTPQLF